MQVNALKSFSLTGMTKLTGGKAQINTPSLEMSCVEFMESVCGYS